MKHLLTIAFATFFMSFLSAQSQESLGRECLNYILVKKDFKAATSYFNEDFKKKLTEPILEQTSLSLDQALGKFVNFIEINKEKDNTYFYYMRFDNQSMDAEIVFDKNNKISTLLLLSDHKNFKKKMTPPRITKQSKK